MSAPRGDARPSDAALAEAEVRRALVPVPVPVPPTNAWVLGHGDVAMVDCGALYGDAEKRLENVLAPGERVAKLLVTHGHPDHHGAAGVLKAKHGCAVFCHPFDAPAVRDFSAMIHRRFDAWAKAARQGGVPEALVARMGEHYRRIAAMGKDTPDPQPLEDGERIEAGGRTLEVLHVPGHTAGSLAFFDPKRKVLFSGDTILPGITPNPFFEGISDHPSGPGPFLASLKRLQELEVDLVLPGHGEPLRDLPTVIAAYQQHHASRRAAITAFLAKHREANAFDAVKELFPGASNLNLWLAFAEVLGHLQYMEGTGEVDRTRAGWRASR